MKKIKWLLALLATLALTAGITACGGGTDSTSQSSQSVEGSSQTQSGESSSSEDASSSEDSSSSSSTSSVTVEYTLTFRAEAGKGSVSAKDGENNPVESGSTLEEGTEVLLTATENAGYTFAGWYNGTTQVATTKAYTHTMTADITLEAKFSTNAYQVKFDATEGGSATAVKTQGGASVTSESMQPFGSSITFTAGTAEEGYEFIGWYAAEDALYANCLEEDNDYVATVLVDGLDLVAAYELKTYTVTFTDTTGGSVLANNGEVHSGESYEHFTQITFTATVTQNGYVFDGWYTSTDTDFEHKLNEEGETTYTISSLTGAVNIVARFVLDSYTVTFTSSTGGSVTATIGGTAIENSQEQTHGSSVTFTAHADTGYVFDAWYVDNNVVGTAGEATYTLSSLTGAYAIEARFERATYLLTHSVTQTGGVKNGEITVKVGNTPVVSGAPLTYGTQVTFTHDPETQKKEGYTFAGWSVDGAEELQTGNSYTHTMLAAADVVAVFRAESRTVTYYDDSVILTSVTANYDSAFTPDYTPSKTNYEFSGWFTNRECTSRYTEGSIIKGNLALYAKWTQTKFSVIFLNHDGTQYGLTQWVENGETFDVPTISRTGYEFDKWVEYNQATQEDTELTQDIEQMTATRNLVFMAKYTPLSKTVIFCLDSTHEGTHTESEKVSVNYGERVTEPSRPTKDGYQFEYWAWRDSSKGGRFNFATLITEDVELYAVWTELDTSVTVRFKVEGESEDFDTLNVEQGQYATKPNVNPTKTGHEFLYWTLNGEEFDFANTPIQSDTTLVASFTKKSYTVTFKDYDGSIIKVNGEDTQSVEYLTSATAPTAPEREGYTFNGWDKEFSSVEDDLTVNAIYTQITYTVTFKVDGNTYGTPQTVAHGATASIPTEPNKENYSFQGWYVEGSDTAFAFTTEIKASLVLYAKFERNAFVVTFLGFEGVKLDTQTVKKGQAATPPDATVVGYEHTGWDTDFSAVTEDMTVQATYTIKSYTVTFKDYNGTVIKVNGEDTQTVNYQQAATAPTDPEREGYTFAGWDKAFTSITEDTTVTATYTRITYTITFMVGDTEYAGVKVADGEVLMAPTTPTPPQAGKVFKHWSSSENGETAFDFTQVITEENKNITLYACFETMSGMCTVTFENLDGNPYGSVQFVAAGGTLNTPPPYQDATGKTYMWCLEEDRTTRFDFTQPITNSIVLVPVEVIEE